ncbi:cAMP-binding domain of CRP or a regulatory subunit of cAMP-dependent protein kinases [Mucilaginibacter gossypiicola]|uniref:cAMP-binding domain of CRP or a regulatory subunit of cAMP-dependent protein kinases n=1 Tax=Mucilaginibacter gossypiicola TaxID=551995 RepID=A0A1H8HWG2_9SPHI|nr:Crp/Fnr family transcriptional regulator [Mucilaginibacter gossypiicola]SEN60038.1 cAMP-binding domain of CRP or a regulatory subunit of cAMP-dependent protein kinases [Mucilaginibacter gossypiicola]
MFELFKEYISQKTTLTDADYAKIKAVCIYKKLRKRQYLLQEGDVWKYNAFITKGLLRFYSVDENGRENIVSFAKENWWTGDRASLLTGEPSKNNIDAIEDTELILITKANFDRLCLDIPAFNDMVNAIINKSFITSQNRIHAAISFTAEQKYLDFVQKYPDLSLRVPQAMIASYLGITPETLSRVRKETVKRH